MNKISFACWIWVCFFSSWKQRAEQFINKNFNNLVKFSSAHCKCYGSNTNHFSVALHIYACIHLGHINYWHISIKIIHFSSVRRSYRYKNHSTIKFKYRWKRAIDFNGNCVVVTRSHNALFRTHCESQYNARQARMR